jgi:hypothetical protein
MRSKIFWFSEALWGAVGDGSLRQDGILGCSMFFTDDGVSSNSGNEVDFPVNQKVLMLPFP